jgi:hypothetical protein
MKHSQMGSNVVLKQLYARYRREVDLLEEALG